MPEAKSYEEGGMRRLSTPAFVLCVMSAATVPIFAMRALPSDLATASAAATHTLTLVVAILVFIRVPGDSPALGRARRLFAGGLVAVTIGLACQVVYVVVGGSIPVPSIGDAFSVLWVPLVVYGLWSLPSRSDGFWSRARLLADGALASSALLMISWVLVMRPLWGTHIVSTMGRGS